MSYRVCQYFVSCQNARRMNQNQRYEVSRVGFTGHEPGAGPPQIRIFWIQGFSGGGEGFHAQPKKLRNKSFLDHK